MQARLRTAAGLSLPFAKLASVLVALAALSHPAPGQAPSPTLLAPTGPEPLLLMASPGGAVIARGEGRQQEPLRVARAAVLSRLEALGSDWVVAGTVPREEHRREILLLAHLQGEVTQLPPPPRRAGQLRHDPVPLVHRQRLVGLAWLQGESLDRLEVWAAAWDGASWHGVQRVAPVAAGSQLALTGAVLDDGSWLLAWSAFDGHADEIRWSLRRQESWTTPRRASLENQVPDITPALVATEGGALLAWSHFDGETYRLQLALWQGESWSAPRNIGEGGGLYPGWRRQGTGALLLFRQALAGTWELLEVDSAGRSLRSASVAAPAAPRPAAVPSAAVTLLFPDGRAETPAWHPLLDR